MYYAWGRWEMHTHIYLENLKEIGDLKDLGTGGRTTLKWIFKRSSLRALTGFMWLGIECSGKLLLTQ
jgi:hypothetical protein